MKRSSRWPPSGRLAVVLLSKRPPTLLAYSPSLPEWRAGNAVHCVLLSSASDPVRQGFGVNAGISRAATCFVLVTFLNELPRALSEADDEQDEVELAFLAIPTSSAFHVEDALAVELFFDLDSLEWPPEIKER